MVLCVQDQVLCLLFRAADDFFTIVLADDVSDQNTNNQCQYDSDNQA